MNREPRVEVELVEDTAPARPGAGPDVVDESSDGGGPEGEGPLGVRSAGRPSWLRPRTLLAGALVVAAGLAGTQAVLDARERATYARVADVRGIVEPLSPELGILWRPDAEQVGLLLDAPEDVDGLSVGVRFDGDGQPSAVALDPRTGERAWSVPLGEADPLLAEALILPRPPCDLSDERLLVCLVGHGYVAAPPEDVNGGVPDGYEATPVPSRGELVVLEASDGHVVRRAAEGVGTALHVLGDLVVTARVEGDASIEVRAHDARSGNAAWAHTTLPGTATASDRVVGGDGTPSVTPVGDAVLVHAGAGGVRIGADGTPEATYLPPAGGDATGSLSVVGGHVLRHAYDGGPPEVLADDGTGTAMPTGYPHELTVDDGSEPDLLLLPSRSGRGLDAWDTRTSRVRWSRPDVAFGDAALLDGTLYVATVGAGAVALDTADGTTRWTSEAPPAGAMLSALSTTTAVTDGRVLALVGQRVSGPPMMLAFTLSDGRLAWTAELPEDVQNVRAFRRQVFGWGYGSTMAVLG